MKQEKWVLVVAILLAGMTQAQAQAQPQTRCDISHCNSGLLSGFYVGIDAGMQNTSIRDQTRLKNDIDWQVAARFNSTLQRYSVGYRFDPNISMELGYIPEFGTRHMSNTGWKKYRAGENLEGVDLGVVYRFNREMPGLIVKTGVSYMKSHAWISYDVMEAGRDGKQRSTNYVETIKGSGLGFLAGIGYELKLTEDLGVNAMYTRYQGISGHNYSAMDVLSLGARYYF